MKTKDIPTWFIEFVECVRLQVLPHHIKLIYKIWSEDYSHVKVDYRYMRMNVEYMSDILESDFDEIVDHVIHEMCHFYTSSGRELFESEEWFIGMLGKNNTEGFIQRMSDMEEQCTVFLTEHYIELVKQTDFYQKAKKEYKNEA